MSNAGPLVSDDIIYAATAWPTNAAMILDVRDLGYLKDSDFVLDPTFGKGAWWRLWHPPLLVGHLWGEKHIDNDTLWDFKDMWYPDETFDAVAFDPPYVSVGGRSTSGIKEMHAAYGMDGTPLSPVETQADMNAGLAECYRVVKRGGIVLIKCQDYVSSGKLWCGTLHTANYAEMLGFEIVDRLEHLSGTRPQPDGRRQVHARRNYSTLFVLRRRKRNHGK